MVRKQPLTPAILSKNDSSQNGSFIFRNHHFDHGTPYSETFTICPVSLGEVYTCLWFSTSFQAYLSKLLFVLLNSISSLTLDTF